MGGTPSTHTHTQAVRLTQRKVQRLCPAGVTPCGCAASGKNPPSIVHRGDPIAGLADGPDDAPRLATDLLQHGESSVPRENWWHISANACFAQATCERRYSENRNQVWMISHRLESGPKLLYIEKFVQRKFPLGYGRTNFWDDRVDFFHPFVTWSRNLLVNQKICLPTPRKGFYRFSQCTLVYYARLILIF